VTLLLALLALQAQAMAAAPALPTGNSVRATRATEAPAIDGRDDDSIWHAAPLIERFVQAKPSEGAPPAFRTEARVAYDEHNLYVFVRAFDPHPDSVIALLSRRDDDPPSDHVTIMLDPYHDRRTGYEFTVNAAGAKADYAIYNDGDEDVAWDAVWDAAARIDSLGWTAEYRIPLSQLNYSSKSGGTFGFLIWRVIQRRTETVTWPLYRVSRSGFTSQFGELSGLDGLGSPGQAELVPYVVTKNVQDGGGTDFGRDQEVTLGGDLRYRLAPNLALNATVNPDFGQVEADPSELNLSAFETFFEERRPFFVEGKGLFTFRVNCVVVVDCSTGEALFYSRRIGRAPQLAGILGGDAPAATRILGAAKVTGRLPDGFSLGVLDAVTDGVSGRGGVTLEPGANYAVVRGNQDFRGGEGSIGFMLTGVNRSLDASAEPYLHRNAYTGGVDARWRFRGRWEVSGSLDLSRVAGDTAAIARTQQSPVHLYQRPDDALRFDPTRTSLSGTNQELRFAKVGGRRLKFETAYQRRTPGFDINDSGFLRQADQQAWTTWAALAFMQPTGVFQQLRWNLNNWEYWTAAGLPTERAFNTNVHVQFNNRWWLHMGGTLGQVGTTYCDRCARGGPAVRQDPYLSPWIEIDGDDRRALVPMVRANYTRGDQGRSETIDVSPEVEFKLASRFTTSLGAEYNHNRNDIQYYGTFTDAAGEAHFAFAHLDQKTYSLTWRLGYTFTPTMSLQVYASPFVSKGTYTDVREIAEARAGDYQARYQPFDVPDGNDAPAGFNFQQFRSNVVFRWEYRPGSTLFLVWSQGREASAPAEGTSSFGRDLGDLFDRRADDTFLVKVSYWLTP
jgi:hypothetical protein